MSLIETICGIFFTNMNEISRDDIGRKYEIGVTETIFTAPSSQIQAERAGFVTLMVQEYSQLRDENGEPLFPNIEHKNVKMMIKRLL